MFDIVGPNDKPVSTTAAVAARSLQRLGKGPLGKVKRIESPRTPNTIGMTAAIFNSGARDKERNVASASPAVSSASPGKVRSNREGLPARWLTDCRGLAWLWPSAPR